MSLKRTVDPQMWGLFPRMLQMNGVPRAYPNQSRQMCHAIIENIIG